MRYLALAYIFLLITDSKAQKFQPNYDESKVPAYTLPEVLRTSQNKVVRNKKNWEGIRRPEILKLFEENIYGEMPVQFDSIKFSRVKEDETAMDGKARLKEVEIQVFKNNQAVKINLLLFIPKGASGPVPLFLLINNRGKENTDPTRTVKSEFWPAEQVIDQGYAIAAFHVGDLAPDNKDLFADGVLRLYPDQLNKPHGMRAIGAWAWGASRAMDYFEADPEIDESKVVLVGHSRGGKASLWAAAQDQRFAICVSNCSGNSGAALARRQFGERISAINDAFPHWFNDNYKKYNNRENDLPVDQHMLISLIAPRPVYATNASEDLWADPTGTFLSLKHAEQVYKLYDLISKIPASPPRVDEPIVAIPLSYHNRSGKHDLTLYDWEQFVKLANLYFKPGDK
jgi:hypothetical protein